MTPDSPRRPPLARSHPPRLRRRLLGQRHAGRTARAGGPRRPERQGVSGRRGRVRGSGRGARQPGRAGRNERAGQGARGQRHQGRGRPRRRRDGRLQRLAPARDQRRPHAAAGAARRRDVDRRAEGRHPEVRGRASRPAVGARPRLDLHRRARRPAQPAAARRGGVRQAGPHDVLRRPHQRGSTARRSRWPGSRSRRADPEGGEIVKDPKNGRADRRAQGARAGTRAQARAGVDRGRPARGDPGGGEDRARVRRDQRAERRRRSGGDGAVRSAAEVRRTEAAGLLGDGHRAGPHGGGRRPARSALEAVRRRPDPQDRRREDVHRRRHRLPHGGDAGALTRTSR